MSMLDKVYLKKLQAGKYASKISSFEEVTMADGRSHIKINYTLPDRIHTDVVFPSNMDFVVGNLKRVFKLEDKDMAAREVFSYAVNKPLDIWIVFTTSEDTGKTYTNVHFYDAAVKTTVEQVDLTTVEV